MGSVPVEPHSRDRDLAGLATSLGNIGVKVADFKNNLGTASGISATVNQFAQSLKNVGTTGAAAWTNF